MLVPDARSDSIGLVGTVQAPPPIPTPLGPDRTLVIALGVALIGGLVVLMLVLALRLIRRVAEGAPIVAAQKRKKRTMRGAGRDPWREAGRRMAVPPRDADGSEPKENDEDEGDGGGSNGAGQGGSPQR